MNLSSIHFAYCCWVAVDNRLLFSGIVELVFIGSAEALLNSGIDPQSFHGGQQLFGEWLRVLHAGNDVHHHLGVGLQSKEKRFPSLKHRQQRSWWANSVETPSATICICLLGLYYDGERGNEEESSSVEILDSSHIWDGGTSAHRRLFTSLTWSISLDASLEFLGGKKSHRIDRSGVFYGRVFFLSIFDRGLKFRNYILALY